MFSNRPYSDVFIGEVWFSCANKRNVLDERHPGHFYDRFVSIDTSVVDNRSKNGHILTDLNLISVESFDIMTVS